MLDIWKVFFIWNQVNNEDDALQALTAEFSVSDQMYGAVPIDHHPVSGIHNNILQSQAADNIIQGIIVIHRNIRCWSKFH